MGAGGAAFISALITVALVCTLSMRDGSSSPAILLVAVLTAAAVAFTGIVMFVELVVPI